VNWPRQRLIRTVGKAEQALTCGAEFLPLFVDYKARGFRAELLGPQTMLGKNTVAVRIDQEGCSSQTYYFDPASYELQMSQAVIPVHARGAMRATISVYAKFMDVNGVRWPSVTQSADLNTGEVLDGALWSSIEANTLPDAAAFQAPLTHPKGGALLALNMLDAQQMHLSPSAILVLYDRFRATPEGKAADVTDDMHWLGFEFLKVDDYSSAIALWDKMAAENPAAPQFHDYLGDAYAQKGDVSAARAAYDKALALGASEAIKAKRDRL
jgi:tetratricopeptide (TPR) repeat protein